ncbi:MFS transporter [Marinobacter fonticola]|uniref:MFS transporter n=1 Tax=Marinobacter fonticola TaxID=2603215 RepID=UPI0011E65D26|nr:MFS transporter [Marinobacter fonticola]
MAQNTSQFTLREALPVLVLLWLAGLYLRIPVLVAPPLAPFIADELALSQALTGALTTVPVLMLAIGAMPGSLAISRLGARTALALALIVVAVGSSLRGLAPDAFTLLAASAVMGLGIAIMQPALPALLTVWLKPAHLALGSSVYMNGMLMGEFIGAGVTLPVLMPLTDDSWRLTLLAWSLPGLLVAGLLFLPKSRRKITSERPAWVPDWRNPLTWKLGLLLGASSALFFGTNAYMANVLEQRGALETLDRALFWFNLAQVAASLIMLKTSRYWVGRRSLIVIMLALAAVTLGLFLATTGLLSIVFAFLMSLTAAWLLILLVALPPLVSRSEDTGRLAAGNFTIGYTLAFAVPMLGGLIADSTGNPNHALITLIVYAVLVLPLAFTLDLRTRSS